VPGSEFRRRLSGLKRIPPWALDGALVAVVATAIGITISVAPEPAAREPDAVAYGLGVLIAALLFGRRRWPIGVLLGSAVILIVYYSLDYPGFFPAVPLAAPLYIAAAARNVGWPIAIAALWFVFPLIFRLFLDPEPVLRVLNDSLREGAFFGAVILLGVAVRSRRAYTTEVAERLRRAEAERERVARELKVARLVQEQFLPDEVPDLPGWSVAAYYRSAREVGGDFYDFTPMPDGRISIAVGDVTDKGAPAALVMATTQGLLRADAPRLVSPSAVLARVNEVLVANTPETMFVTCLYILLDPATGRVQFANAGHNLPYMATVEGVVELRATGMPLGLMAGTAYDEADATLPPRSRLLLHSDGLAEAHNRDREMFGFPRLMKVVENCPRNESLIDAALAELDRFVGPQWEQEDDITLVTIERSLRAAS
jgi:serine phosphatase RsbU (regulator of sigma subunit)